MRVLDRLRCIHSKARNTGSIRLALYGFVACCIELFQPPQGLADTPAKDGDSWPLYGRTSDESHYSPLDEINSHNVSRLGLVWWFDIPRIAKTTSTPVQVGGTLYFSEGYSVIRALNSTTGRLLWTYDPKVPKVAGHKLRFTWGVRGIGYWDNKIYVGTHDGRLIALNAQTGKLIWSVVTTQPGDSRIITGPPLLFRGRVLIGHGNAEFGSPRGYVTAYDAQNGRMLWRFFTVPGNPKDGFENKTMEMAAKTWSGQWWKYGGGATVWNAMTYDAELNRIYVGTGNGTPSRAKERDPAGGDNLFVASIVALNADTGEYTWHYQLNPAETWDYDAAGKIQLTTATISGVSRRILMQASKNGFFYVIDRDTGKLLSAEKFAKVTWAERIDIETGRPVENLNARVDRTANWPSSIGAHSPLQPMAFNPRHQLVYIPVIDEAAERNSAFLLAWHPLMQKAAWRVALPGVWSGGALTTGGDLVFQGRSDGKLVAYDARTGATLWSYDAQVGILGAPITYRVNNRQYVSLLVGYSGIAAVPTFGDSGWSARAQKRRLLTFALDGNSQLPPAPAAHQT